MTAQDIVSSTQVSQRYSITQRVGTTDEFEFGFGLHDFILIDPFFEGLWDDPEFQAIVKQAQEEKAALRAQVREMEERGELDL